MTRLGYALRDWAMFYIYINESVKNDNNII